MPRVVEKPQTAFRSDLAAELAAELRRAQDQASTLERELANRDFDVSALEDRSRAVEAGAQARVAELEAHAANLEARAIVAETQAAELHALLMALYGSTSWRLMGPMRRLVRLMRRLLGRR